MVRDDAARRARSKMNSKSSTLLAPALPEPKPRPPRLESMSMAGPLHFMVAPAQLVGPSLRKW